MYRIPYLLFICLRLSAQEPPRLAEPIYGLPASFARQPGESICLQHHPASLRKVKGKELSFFSERLFGLPGFNPFFINLALRVAGQPLGFFLHQSGTAFFRENGLGLAMALPASNNLHAGLRLNYHHWKMPASRLSGVSAKTGILFDLGKEIEAGFLLQLAKLAGHSLQWVAHQGLSWEPNDHWMTALTFSLFREGAGELHGFLRYQPVKGLLLYWGYLSASEQWYMGLGFQVNKWRLTLYGRSHPYLGWTPGIQWQFTQKGKS